MDRRICLVSTAWNELRTEILRWRDAGRTVEFWLRDDDAARPHLALEQLLELTGRWHVPVSIAVIPQLAEPALFAGLPAEADVLQHGSDHVNRAGEGQKKTEYPAEEPSATALRRLCEARDRLSELAGVRSIGVLAPPWNRVAPHLLAQLAAQGFRGLSRFGPRQARSPGGLLEINTHVDLIAWKSDRGFVGVEPALRQAISHLAARRAGTNDPDEPTGWLSHHACHDAATWNFLEELFGRLQSEAGVRWRSARELFTSAAPAPAGR